MAEVSIHPSTLDGIKRLAKQIKAQQNLNYHLALDEAARNAGFQNFRHAQNSLGKSKPALIQRGGQQHAFPVYITAMWRNKPDGKSGQEILRIELSVPRLDLMSPGDLAKNRAFRRFGNSGPDHLELSFLAKRQEEARSYVCAAARALQFMDATKLRPSKAFSKAYPGGSIANEIPGRDHPSVWYDRTSKGYVYVDEPYEKAVAHYEAERFAWAEHHGQVIAKPTWRGIYAPAKAPIHLISDKIKGVPLAPLIAALNSLPPPITIDAWTGESVPMLPPFISPGAISQAVEHQQQPKHVPHVGPRKTVGYIRTFIGPQRRPDACMPIEAHRHIGELLKSVLAESHKRKGVYNSVDSVRSELDEWVQREYPSETELPNEQFNELYYREGPSPRSRVINEEMRAHHLRSLEDAKLLLAQHYPECVPLRSVLHKLDRAIVSMKTWSK